MAENRGNASGSNTNMPNGITRNHSNDNINNNVMNALSVAMGKPLALIESNTKENKQLTLDIKKELMNFSKSNEQEKKDKIRENKKQLQDFSKPPKDNKNSRDDIKNGLKLNKFFSTLTKGVKDVFEKNKKSLQGILGPLNVLFSPLKEFFGGFGTVFKSLGNGVKTLFGKFTKKNPTANDVIKTGAFGVGSLFIVSEIKKIFGKDDKGKNGLLDKFKSLFTFGKGSGLAGLGTLTKSVGKVAGPLAIATALIMMAIDGIKGVFKAKEWGVSKVSAGLGSFLGGASEGGLKNAFKEMGKWALLGAGIGSVVPVIGTIAGGILGAVIGGILGAIGGKNLAKGFDKIGQWFKEVLFGSWKDTYVTMFSNIKNIWKSDDSLGKKFGKIIGEVLMTPFNSMKNFFVKNKNFFSKITGDKKFKESVGNFGASILKGLKNIDFKSAFNKVGGAIDKVFEFSADLWDGVKESTFGQFVGSIFNSIKDKFAEVWNNLKESKVGQFVGDLFDKMKEGINKFLTENPIGKWVDSHVITPIKKALNCIGDFFTFISDNWDWHHPIQSMTTIFEGFKEDKKTGTSKFEEWRNAKYEVDDAIIRTDGSIIKTNPKDTLVALKDIPMSLNQVREDTNRNLNSSLGTIENNGNLDKNMTTIIDVLSKILEKDVQIQLPPQTRTDLDMLMSGGMI